MTITQKKVVVIIPIYQPDEKFCRLLDMLHKQYDVAFDIYIIDSGSEYNLYRDNLTGLRYTIVKTSPREFNHGGTRQKAAEACKNYSFLVYMTQDAILADESAIRELIDTFSDPKVGCAYGRQLPHKDADIFAVKTRLFNYPPQSRVKSVADVKELGIKVSFISDSFAAYRREALEDVGGFPVDIIFGEDAYVASKMILSRWKVAYCAEAKVYHSHNYTIIQEFRRYFDTGVFHSRESWIRNSFGAAESEGMRLVISEIEDNIIRPWKIPNVILRNGMKYLGYKLGTIEKYLPIPVKRKWSMMPFYWIK